MANHFRDTYRKADDDITEHQGRVRARRIMGDRIICTLCESDRFLDVHHKDRNPLNNAKTNLIVLCRSCHQMEHRKKSKCSLCDEVARAHGFCSKHLTRMNRHGDARIVRGQVELSEDLSDLQDELLDGE